MTLPFSRAVRITSSVGGAAVVADREQIGRIFTPSQLCPINQALEFGSADAVAAHFGADSLEATRARFYFSYIDPNGGMPSKLSFSRFASQAAPAVVYGAPGAAQLQNLVVIALGTLTIDVDGVPVTIAPIDLTASASFAVVAAKVQTAVQANANPALSTATVTYDGVRQAFVVTSGTQGAGSLVITGNAGNPNDLAAPMGLLATAPGAIVSPGTGATTPMAALAASVNASDNFGTFCFMSELTQPNLVSVAMQNAAYNVRFMFLYRVSTADALVIGAAMKGIASQGPVHALNNGQFPEMLPMALAASINYSRPDASVNFMFRNNPGATLLPTVFDESVANQYDALRINYVGETQNAGRKISYFQLGNLGGGTEAIIPMGVHINEQWLKSAMTAKLGDLLLSLGRIPANADGRGLIMTSINGVVNRALTNGVISVGKELTDLQKAFVIQRSDDPRAPIQVASDGYWLDVVIRDAVDSSGAQYYYAAYVLIYAKDDAIRRIDGTHNLI